MKKIIMNPVPYSLPDIGGEEIEEVVDTLKSGWMTTGPKVKKFEQDFVNFIGQNVNAISVNSATAGLHLALEALGIKEGDEVIVPSLTFTATAGVVRHIGAEVKLVDINPITLNMDCNSIKDSITSKTKAIILVHYAGLSCDMDEILLLAKSFELKVIEDASHALSSTYKGNPIGSLKSDATVFSFYANKNMTTGEGGMVVVRDESLAKHIKMMRLHGIDKDVFDRFQSIRPIWYYEVVSPGFKYNMTDIAAAIGIHQLKKLPKFLEIRQKLAARYLSELSNLPIILPTVSNNRVHAWHLFVIRLNQDSTINRDELIEYLSKKNIGTSVHYNPLHRQPYWRDRYKLTGDMFPEAEKAYQSMVSIPLYTLMTSEQQDYIIEALRSVFK
jgi:dTDP-4-amino-4,6-dideoxygalactose transaminase